MPSRSSASNLLPGISATPLAPQGSGDDRIQSVEKQSVSISSRPSAW
ncbi:hypothetical protein ACIBD9_24820 [Micromonospora sp. NPDC050784]